VVSGINQQLPWWDWEEMIPPMRPGTNIHGEYRLPSGYCLCVVPSNAPLSFARDGSNQIAASGASVVNGVPMLASSYNAVKLIVSLIQAIWAVATLYRARGNQIEEYGYAAFGLTVAPYAWMSIVNVIASLSCPNYPAMFMIRTPIMNEAEQAGGAFSGELHVNLGQNQRITKRSRIESALVQALMWFLAVVPIIIVGGLSRFAAGNSTAIERGFTMFWLVAGVWYGVLTFGNKLSLFPRYGRLSTSTFKFIWDFVWILFSGVPAVGGMVVVGMMLHQFGECTRFS